MKRWQKSALVGIALLAAYEVSAVAFMTGRFGTRTVSYPIFKPYLAPPSDGRIPVEAMQEKIELLGPRQEPSEARSEASALEASFAPEPPLLPDLRIFEPADLHLVGSKSDDTLRLKFGTTIWNAGPGPLEARGAENAETGELEVYQYLYLAGAEGRAEQGRRIGAFNYDHRHGHLHLEAFARYELWSLDENGELLEPVATNRKVGFCLMDNKVVAPEIAAPERPAVYVGCRAEVQGISVGYGDEYVAQLYEQDINVSRIPDGDYALMTIANPDLALEETNYENNAAVVYLSLAAGRLVEYPLEQTSSSATP